MDHLTEKEHSAMPVFLQGLVADINCVLDAIAKPEMTREIELHRTKIEHRRREVLLPYVLLPTNLFHPAGKGGPIIGGYVEFLDGCTVKDSKLV
jgi:hypothetical protein